MLKRMCASDTQQLAAYLESRTEDIDCDIIAKVSRCV